MERMGAGELLIQSVNKDGTYQGLEVAVLQEVSQSVGIPVVGLGGLASLEEIRTIHPRTNLNGYAAGSLFIYQGKHRGVLVNYPSADEVKKLFN
jgi:cyclase